MNSVDASQHAVAACMSSESASLESDGLCSGRESPPVCTSHEARSIDGSVRGSVESVEMHEELGDAHITYLMHILQGLLFGYVLCASLTFCSSSYTLGPSRVDSVIALADAVTLDIASALMFCAGFVVSYMHANMTPELFTHHVGQTLIFVYTDVVAASLLSAVLGVLWCIDLNICEHSDVALTLVEGFSATRLFDLQHSGWHSLNVTAWPALCLVWSLLLAKLPLEGNVFLYERMGLPALLVVNVLSLIGILILNVSAIVHSDTDVFYASASNMTYRIQEFNVGLNVAFLFAVREPVTAAVRNVLAEAFYVICYVQTCLWWSEIGQEERAPAAGACMRLYPRSGCVPPRHAFMLRGCVLGLVLLCRREIPAGSPSTMTAATRDVSVLRVLCSAVVFSWPVFIGLRFVTHIVFGAERVHAHSATLSAVIPMVLLVMVAIYDGLVKPHVCQYAHQATKRVHAVAARLYDSWSENVRIRYHAGAATPDAPPG